MQPDFAEIYDEHVDAVYGYSAYRCRSRQEAEELTRETFGRAERVWDRLDPAQQRPRTWLMNIARNAYIDSRVQAAEERRRHAASGRPGDDGDLGSAAELGPDPEIVAALRKIHRREREAVALRFGGELSIREVASVLDVSVGTVQQTLSRALQSLHGLLVDRSESLDVPGPDDDPDADG